MGRIGEKKKLKDVRKTIPPYIEAKVPYKFDINDYDKLSELDKLVSIQNFYTANAENKYIGEIINQIMQGNAVEREVPDIGGYEFGIEHTEISPFYRHKKKGDSFRRFQKSMSESKRIIELDIFDIFFLDLTIFFQKLGIKNRSQFKENIIQAIKEKSKKFEAYEHFKHNGLWLDSLHTFLFLNRIRLGTFCKRISIKLCVIVHMTFLSLEMRTQRQLYQNKF